MNLPATWHNETRSQTEAKPTLKKARHSVRTRAAAAAIEDSVPGASNIADTVKNIICNSPELTPASFTIGLDSVISRLPYRRIIEDVYENWESTPPDIPLVTRAYEESFMRECRDSSEKQCVMMNNCECMQIDKSNRFIGTEFLLPGEAPGVEARMCVLCLRQLTQKMYYDLMFDGRSFRFPIQKYGNICNEPGEYAKEVTTAPHSVPHWLLADSLSSRRGRSCCFAQSTAPCTPCPSQSWHTSATAMVWSPTTASGTFGNTVWVCRTTRMLPPRRYRLHCACSLRTAPSSDFFRFQVHV